MGDATTNVATNATTRNDAHAVVTHNESDDVLTASHDAECNGLQPSITNDANSNATPVAVAIAVQSLSLGATTTTTAKASAIITSWRLLSLPLKSKQSKSYSRQIRLTCLNSFYLINESPES